MQAESNRRHTTYAVAVLPLKLCMVIARTGISTRNNAYPPANNDMRSHSYKRRYKDLNLDSISAG